MGLDNPIHIAFLLILLLLVFGAKRLPEMGRSLGSGLRGFKETLNPEQAHAPLVASQPEPVAAAPVAAPMPVAPPMPVATTASVATPVRETGAPVS
jgi:sec-independent protein translocase protein TatA